MQQGARAMRAIAYFFYLLPLWEKVARTKSATDEGYSKVRSL